MPDIVIHDTIMLPVNRKAKEEMAKLPGWDKVNCFSKANEEVINKLRELGFSVENAKEFV